MFLGTAIKPDGSVAARFSDTAKLDLNDDQQVQQFKNKFFHYEKQFDIASGQYTLTVVFSAADGTFGRLQAPLSIDSYDPSKFSVSGIAFSTDTVRIADTSDTLEQQLLHDHYPLVSRGLEFVPSGKNQFAKSDAVFLYFEIYEPLLAGPKPPNVAVQYVVANLKTKQLALNTGLIPMDALVQPGNPIIAAGLKLPLESLPPGSYHLELRASDSSGESRIRAADFEVRQNATGAHF